VGNKAAARRHADERVLVLAPTGRDAALASGVVRHAGLTALECPGAGYLLRELTAGAGVALVAEEALSSATLDALQDVLRRQEPWSDIPIIVFTAVGESIDDSTSPLRVLEPLGNVTILERPVRMTTLLSAVKTALRARRRQYEVRDHLEARRRAEAERERLLAAEQVARAEVEAAARAKDEFLAVLSHELRTPLQSMLGWIKVLQSERLDEVTRRRAMQSIERGTRAQAQLIEDLLDISRIIAGKMRVELRPVEVESILAAAIDAVSAASEQKRGAVATGNRARDVEVAADPNRLQQIVWHLHSNAVKFSREGGRVEVTVDRLGGDAVIAVRDDGVGIASDVLPRIFERFHQADSSSTRAHGGLGLGLAIVRHLVELHSGKVGAQSDGLGHGATFTVRLPALPAVSAGPERAAVRDRLRGVSSDTALTGLRLLLVEDDGDALELLATVLRQRGADVVAVRTAGDALAALEKGSIDVIVSDISMPGEDGYSFMRRVRERDAALGHVPALALTAHARPEDTQHAFLAGFEAHVAKPIDPGFLAQLIAKLAGRAAAA
jgi:signal transduction histidine kinase/ActR/RegA family two-component response regulator